MRDEEMRDEEMRTRIFADEELRTKKAQQRNVRRRFVMETNINLVKTCHAMQNDYFLSLLSSIMLLNKMLGMP